MNNLENVYKQSLEENERNLNYYQDYLNNLNALDLSVFKDKLTVPILVPIGNKILFRGALKHTNEVTVSLGADYFVKCSLTQAEALRQHRIKDAKSKFETYKVNEEYLEKQLNLNKSIYENPGKDIIETCTEEEDKLWREKHKERVRQYNLSAEKKMENNYNQVTDEELWTRLEELEIQEELEEEYRSMTDRDDNIEPCNSYILKDTACAVQRIKPNEENTSQEIDTNSNEIESNLSENGGRKLSKTQLLQQIIERQRSLDLKLTELKTKNTAISRTENDLYAKLDEIEQLDELEDEIDRLDDILSEDSDDTEETIEEISNTYSKKTVSFADDDESKTLELEFKHSNVEPDTSPYNPEIGITKPSHIYEAFSNLFVDERMSILKKTKRDSKGLISEGENNNLESLENISETRTIVVKDVSEKVESDEKLNSPQRPVSLFKKRRQQQKT